MVVKLSHFPKLDCFEFESSVISYGSEAAERPDTADKGFESSVISYGSEAKLKMSWYAKGFESSVISYGSEAYEN